MKSNVPEKVYISDSELNDSEHCIIWFKSQQNEKDIEYIKKDAFIEKAYTYLNEKCRRFILTEKDIEDFIDYMKGE